MTGTDPTGLTATELLDAYGRRELTPVEATEAVLERIERIDPRLNAFCLVDPEWSLEAARTSAERWRRGEPAGLLDGVPVSIKDILITKGRPTLRGSRTIDPGLDWPEDAPSVARLYEHGAVPIGKTTTPEFAWKGVTDSPLTGVTRNPWDTARTPGGSSGGAAAAVAAGLAPLALGTDGGGSVRIPAAFTGTVTLKPTYGLVPHYPASPFGTLAHVGPMTRTVRDAALLLDVITGFDGRDWSALPPPREPFSTLAGDVSGLRVAFSPELGFASVDPEVAALVDAAAGVFAELGAKVERADPGFADPVEDFEVLWFAGAAKVVENLTEEERGKLDPGLREICDKGAQYSLSVYLDAVARRRELGRIMGLFHEEYDLLLTPTVPIPAFEAGRESPADGLYGGVGRWTAWTPFTYPFNMTQQPAASVPCGFTPDGLPAGLQIVGPRHADARVMNAALAYERARPWHERRPPLDG
ncbi:amidase [Actinomadura sp. NBRC 104412]|uniref:amidase n=1 Tax=Actinomadura sp. NBRC 104412 TaxID=3032203 RepID=UPI0024A51233|nr:amidase [Actinomadura sp. NBRC 104412]GLZ08667.1 amidase [Actinomadura sp. NBRC 104412]